MATRGTESYFMVVDGEVIGEALPSKESAEEAAKDWLWGEGGWEKGTTEDYVVQILKVVSEVTATICKELVFEVEDL